MKKIIFAMMLAATPTLLFAQLKVKATGNVAIKDTNNSSTAYLSVGDITEGYSLAGSEGIGIHALKYEPAQYGTCVGIFGEARKLSLNQTNSGLSIGIWGQGYGAAAGRNIGVLATTIPDGYGVGIYATNEGGIAPPEHHPTGTYAAYFYGDTYLDGNITSPALYNMSDIRLKRNITSLTQNSGSEGSTLENLQNLDIISYNLERPSQQTSKELVSKGSNKLTALKEIEAKRRHYGLSAQELQKIYPDLVLEGQDGYLAVNYIELVPILIRSIQELKAELDEVRGGSSDVVMSRTVSTSAVSATTTTGNVLYQNTPNPFKEQTTIRFSLADDARDAAVCIFDMTGKMLKKLPISSGETSVTIGGYELGEGMFLYTLIVNGREIDTKRMIITK